MRLESDLEPGSLRRVQLSVFHISLCPKLESGCIRKRRTHLTTPSIFLIGCRVSVSTSAKARLCVSCWWCRAEHVSLTRKRKAAFRVCSTPAPHAIC